MMGPEGPKAVRHGRLLARVMMPRGGGRYPERPGAGSGWRQHAYVHPIVKTRASYSLMRLTPLLLLGVCGSE
jgi:hypothetical protein